MLQFHYTAWPDFGLPESPASFLEFLAAVKESGCLDLSKNGPTVVHCSAGIGRSGTFCLVDTCLVLVCQSSVSTSRPVVINILSSVSRLKNTKVVPKLT